MIYEFRTYDLKPRAVPEFEETFAKLLPERETFSPLGGIWHTEAGPLNQVIMIWPYDDLNHREEVRAHANWASKWPESTARIIENMNSEIYTPATFMEPLGQKAIGPLYEIRIYAYPPGGIPTTLEAWGKVIEERTKFSPLAGAWYSESGNLNKWVHLLAYESFEQRLKVREDTRLKGVWPPTGTIPPLKQESKLLFPASCSPMQ